MPTPSNVVLRLIEPSDVNIVASLHARSWRKAYRGILADAYLDQDLESERQAVWTAKLAAHDAGPGWLAAMADEYVGFVYVRPGEDARWGTLVDNLHVMPTHQGLGVGRRLLHTVGTWTAEHHPDAPVHLWVFAENHPAREFYRRMGGAEVEFVDREASDGRSLPEYRVAWTSPAVLIGATTSAA
jgi:GNAT superfamily N-acetyltransferase